MRDRSEYLNQLVGHDPNSPPITNTDIPHIESALPPCWRVVGVWHLSGDQNQGKHNVYVDVLDQNGQVVAPPMTVVLTWNWAGMRPDETPPPVWFDKKPPEPAANIPIFAGHLRIWITGGGLPSDRVSDLGTDYPGTNGNSYGHHSYYVVFQKTTPTQPPPPPTTSGTGTILAPTNLRKSSGYIDKPPDDVLAVLPTGTVVEVTDGPVHEDDLDWYKVISSNGAGWVAHTDPWGVQLLLLPGEELVEHPDLASPVPPGTPITQGYGDNEGAYAEFGLIAHNGIDYGCPVGTPVTATDDGRFYRDGWDDGGYGLWLKLQHTWGYSLYAHLDEIVLAEGELVKQGQLIAKSGNSGNSTGPHLHFGVQLNGFNPADGMGGYGNPEA